MTAHRCLWTLVVASLFIAAIGAEKADAFPQRRGWSAPGVTYYSFPGPAGASAGLPYVTPGANYLPLAPSYYPYYYHPYIAPYPAYGIMPPPFGTMNILSGQGQYGRTDGNTYRSTRELDYTPRKRPDLNPAIPFEPRAIDILEDIRRVRFDVTVPTEDAIVIFDGVETKQKGLKRLFVTPPVEEDRLYTSTIEVRWVDAAGAKHTRTEKKEFVAGEKFTIVIK